MKNIVIAVVSSVIGGIIIAIFNYTFLRDQPEAPSIDISQRTAAVPVESGKSLLLPSLTASSSFSGIYAVQTFDIKNYGDKIYKDVLFRATDFQIAVIEHNGRTEALTGDKLLDMNPGDTFTLSGVSLGKSGMYGIVSIGKFFVAVGDRLIPIRSSDVDESSPISPIVFFAMDNPFTAYMAVMVMALLSVLSIVAIALGTIITFSPQMQLRMTSNKAFGQSLAYLNFIKGRDEDRYAEITKLAATYERMKLARIVDATSA